MNQLGHTARADGSDVEDLVGDGIQYRFAALENGLVATDPDGQFAGFGAGGSSADGCVQHVQPTFQERGVQLAQQGRRVGAQVEVHAAARQAADQPIRAESDVPDLGRARQRRQHNLTGLGNQTWRVGQPHPRPDAE